MHVFDLLYCADTHKLTTHADGQMKRYSVLLFILFNCFLQRFTTQQKIH